MCLLFMYYNLFFLLRSNFPEYRVSGFFFASFFFLLCSHFGWILTIYDLVRHYTTPYPPSCISSTTFIIHKTMFAKPIACQIKLFSVNVPRRFSSAVAVTPKLLDLRVGKIVKIKNHENANRLYISQVQVEKTRSDKKLGNLGYDPNLKPKTVQVCSGLVGLVPKSQLLNSKVVLVMNLKPSKMRGVQSEAMLLAAEKPVNNIDGTISRSIVQVVRPPECSDVGQSVEFQGFERGVCDELKRVNKKKWDQIALGLKTNAIGEVCYIDEACTLGFETKNGRGVCTVGKELANCKVR